MSILFICQANVGRSQAAMELYRRAGGDADSAGTKVDEPGTTLNQRPGAVTIVNVMRDDYGIDMNSNVRTQLTEDLASRYDRLIVMAEPETWPGWLTHDKRATYWILQTLKEETRQPRARSFAKLTKRSAHSPRQRYSSYRLYNRSW